MEPQVYIREFKITIYFSPPLENLKCPFSHLIGGSIIIRIIIIKEVSNHSSQWQHSFKQLGIWTHSGLCVYLHECMLQMSVSMVDNNLTE